MPTRRDILRGLAATAGAGLGSSLLLDPRALAEQGQDPRFLLVFCATGGGSIIDGPLAIAESEASDPATLNCFPDSQLVSFDGSPFRFPQVDSNNIGAIPSGFSVDPSTSVGRRLDDLTVATWTRTSVNHAIGQRRAVTGNEAWRGRTLQEIVAWQYGANAPIPNAILLPGLGFADNGTDDSVPAYARGQVISNPATFPLSLDGSRGQPDGLSPEVLAAVRQQRNDVFEPGTRFQQIFSQAPKLLEWQDLRGPRQERIEALDLITKLMVPTQGADSLAALGLEASPAAQQVLGAFPNLAVDPFEAQAALAFLLLKYRVSVSVTLGPSFSFVYDSSNGFLADNSVLNPPLAFDFSHQGHRQTQALVWNHIYSVIDRLIGLLETEDFGDGSSLWDRSLVYVASDFGREKTRPANAGTWGTGHSLNNGVHLFSPLTPGNTLLGGVDPTTGLTYGFDPQSGAPDPGRQMAEAEIFSGILGALDIDLSDSGLPDVPAMRRS